MLLSASRRTDIPSYYADWFYNRIKEGFVMVRNPMNPRQISKINLSPEVVDGIVFWTKNPQPMISRLDELGDYMFYFQFTITPYGKDIEPNLPSKSDELLATFKTLSNTLGANRVIWRYDPILINKKYTFDYHTHAFGKIAEELQGYTRKVTISFIDVDYRGVKDNLAELALDEFPPVTQVELASRFAEIARKCGLMVDTCAENLNLSHLGIEHARCIDEILLGELLGCNLIVEKDKNQRFECACKTSIDIGMFNTCLNGCRYCYANYSPKLIDGNYEKHNPQSPLISGDVNEGDKINERVVKSHRNLQLQL